MWKSPCINKGDPDTTGMALPSQDLSGAERIYEGRVDIGAYEYNRSTSIPENRQEKAYHLHPIDISNQPGGICTKPGVKRRVTVPAEDYKGVIDN